MQICEKRMSWEREKEIALNKQIQWEIGRKREIENKNKQIYRMVKDTESDTDKESVSEEDIERRKKWVRVKDR